MPGGPAWVGCPAQPSLCVLCHPLPLGRRRETPSRPHLLFSLCSLAQRLTATVQLVATNLDTSSAPRSDGQSPGLQSPLRPHVPPRRGQRPASAHQPRCWCLLCWFLPASARPSEAASPEAFRLLLPFFILSSAQGWSARPRVDTAVAELPGPVCLLRCTDLRVRSARLPHAL